MTLSAPPPPAPSTSRIDGPPELVRETAHHLDALVTSCCAAAGVVAGDLVAWIHRAAARPGGEGRTAWEDLGTELARLGPHRLRLAMHVVRRTATSREIAYEEEERLAAWFRALVEEGISLTGGTVHGRRGDDNPAASALWNLFYGDRIETSDAHDNRCPVVGEMPCPNERGFVTALVDGAVGYLRTVIAGAGRAEAAELRALASGADADCELYRPFAFAFGSDERRADLEREDALALMTLRRPTAEQLCQAVGRWTESMGLAVRENTIPPVNRVGAVVWLVGELRRSADARRGTP